MAKAVSVELQSPSEDSVAFCTSSNHMFPTNLKSVTILSELYIFSCPCLPLHTKILSTGSLHIRLLKQETCGIPWGGVIDHVL